MSFFGHACAAIEVTRDGHWMSHAGPTQVSALLPGSFDPVHEGHWGMAEAAQRTLGQPVAFELSIMNVDKPTLSEETVRERIRRFEGRASVWLTRAATFLEKAKLFPGTSFVVGADTAARIISDRYYGCCRENMLECLARLRQLDCRFLVAGRWDGQTFLRLQDLDVPAEFLDLFADIDFRHDISSSELRREASRGHG